MILAALRRLLPPRPSEPRPWDTRWVCGDITRFCGHDLHERCAEAGATIVVGAGIWSAPCLCSCHPSESGEIQA